MIMGRIGQNRWYKLDSHLGYYILGMSSFSKNIFRYSTTILPTCGRIVVE